VQTPGQLIQQAAVGGGLETPVESSQEQSLVARRLTAPSGEAWEEVVCPLCSRKEARPWLQARDRLFGAPDIYSLVRCCHCDLQFMNPRPTYAALASHYRDDYAQFKTPKETPWYMRPFIQGWEVKATRRRLRDMEKVLGRVTSDMRFLDVGCGLNTFLGYVQKKRGAQGVGVDINERAIAYVRSSLGMNARLGTLASVGLDADQFDVAMMLHYLEHEGDPRVVLREVRRVLKPRGHLVIEIPDATGWPARLFKSRWASLDIPRHLVFFREATLRQALVEEGFKLLSYRTFGVPLWIGISVYYALQRHNRVDDYDAAVLASTLMGAPLLPLVPWTHEFAFAIAQVES